MIYEKIEINGLRGFGSMQTIKFGIPDGNIGSGLTIIVGPNNSGKSTVIEAINAFNQNLPPSFPEGKRNIGNGKKIEIALYDNGGHSATLKTAAAGGSETEFIETGLEVKDIKPFIVPSRRMFEPYFDKTMHSREQHIEGYALPAKRGMGFNQFTRRLFKIQPNQAPFNAVVKKVLGSCPEWYIEQADNGQYYLKFVYENSEHNSDGSGEGLLSIFIIVDSLYDSSPGDLIVIDEPELSVHPALQKKLIELFADYAKDRQIIISTHSPYFIDWESIINGAPVVRVVKESNVSTVHTLSAATVQKIKNLGGIPNPHTYGLDAKEVFFLHENIVLVEGQEDVVIYKRILQQLGITLEGDFYGWGVGGADNMKNVASILKDLGFKKVYGLLDANKAANIPGLEADFLEYKFVAIRLDDVRDKPAIAAKPAVVGLSDDKGILKPENKASVEQIFSGVNTFFKPVNIAVAAPVVEIVKPA
jgi:predicted ATPase